MNDSLDKLVSAGFKACGSWNIANDKINYDIDCATHLMNVLYAFIVEGKVMYIGKTNRSLPTRLAGYKKLSRTQSTNIKNNRNICECLKCGKRVEIYFLPDNGLLKYGSFHLNVAAGLKDSLIRELAPVWNGGKKEAIDGSLKPLTAPGDNPQETKDSFGLANIPIPRAADFRDGLNKIFLQAAKLNKSQIIVKAGELHKKVGGRSGSDARMPTACDVMRRAMHAGDSVVNAPPNGRGASLAIRYQIPRAVV